MIFDVDASYILATTLLIVDDTRRVICNDDDVRLY